MPRDHMGRFVPAECPLPECGCGTLRNDGRGVWRCDGLADPECDDQELVACTFTHIDGEPYKP